MGKSSVNGDSGGKQRPDGRGSSTEALPADASSSLSTHESGDGSPASAGGGDPDMLRRGSTVGRFTVLERLGAGAMGVVYAAYDPELDRKIALKLLRPQEQTADQERRQARMVREAKAIAKVSHPNVVGIFEIGVHDGHVFMAMEHLAGGTLQSWVIAKKRHWRDIVKMFIQVGHGLAGAHAEGLIHRDFKPDNVLIDKNGVPKVVDFGLVRLSAAAEDLTTSGPLDVAAVPAAAAPAALTRTGALTGTPAYMAPEQFRGHPVDARTDQFAFCVSLYEALYGERPFPGDNLIALADSVTIGRIREAPKGTDVPGWVRRAFLRGLSINPDSRFPGVEQLIDVLADDPAVRRRRRVIVGSVGIVALTATLFARHLVTRHGADIDRQVAQQRDAAARFVNDARTKVGEAQSLRQRSFAAFDNLRREDGEALWREARLLVPVIDTSYEKAEQALQTSFNLDRSRSAIRDELVELTHEHILFAEDFRMDNRGQVLKERLAAIDTSRSKRKASADPGTLTLQVTPADGRVVLEASERQPATGERVFRELRVLGIKQTAMALAPGSYRLRLEAPGRAKILVPFEIHSKERLPLTVQMPLSTAVPRGFVHVPAGHFWFGDANEELRTQFLDAVPIHKRYTPAYLIAQSETTFADWMEFLNDLGPSSSSKHLPNVSTALRGWLRLLRKDQKWELSFQPATTKYSAHEGETINYVGRKSLARQDWSRFPVSGISRADMDAYVEWLRTTTRLPGARLCTELEWERAARGSDDRVFPHGDELRPEDANFDLTYGKIDSAFGPDVVGAHPRSRSPFGVDDLAGNVLEIVTSSVKANELVIRGGAYYFGAVAARNTNRMSVPLEFRDVTTGFRVCTSIVGGQ